MGKPCSLTALLLLALGFALPGCSQPAATDPGTMTNAQGCTRKRGGPQDPAATPPPLMEACLGPYPLRIPANYFDDQMGPSFDGSFGLALEYPGLEAFAPGARAHLPLAVSLRTVSIDYAFVDGGDVEQVLRSRYSPAPYLRQYPENLLETRLKGSPVHGLTPYYADIAAYTRAAMAAGARPTPEPHAYNDWFLKTDAAGKVTTFIACTSREITEDGVALRAGHLVSGKGDYVPHCTQTFTIPENSIVASIEYVRFALPDWERFEQKARALLKAFAAGQPARNAPTPPRSN